jgi:hypothetical protein
MLNRDIFALKEDLETIKTEVQRLRAWLGIAHGRLEDRIGKLEEAFNASEVKKASNQAALTRPILRRPQ